MAYYQSDVLTKDTSSRNSSSKQFTLYVNNLPDELNKHGLLQIFDHYGKVIKHFYRPNTNWAYVTYGTYHEAESAIKDLDNISPLHLKVSFAKEKKLNTVQFPKSCPFINAKQQKDYNIKDIVSLNKPLIQTKGRGKLLDISKKVERNTRIGSITYMADTDSLYSYPSDSHTYDLFENAEPFESINTLWTRGQLVVTRDGKRHVSLGRGYTMYEIPDPDLQIQKQIRKVYEKRTTGLYEYGIDMLESTIGKCQKCSKTTKFLCERCYSFYCSENCQVADWSQHKFHCQTIPALVTTMNNVDVSQSNTEKHTPSRNISNIQIPLRRPKMLTNTVSSLNENLNFDSKVQDTIDIHGKMHDDNLLINESKWCASVHDRNNIHSISVDNNNKLDIDNKHIIQTKNSSFKKSQNFDKIIDDTKSDSLKTFIKIRQNFSTENIIKLEEDIAFSKYTFLSKSKFTDVRIIVKSGCEYWVQKVEDDNNLRQLKFNLQYEADKVEKVVPIVSNIYAVQYENEWYRALVTSLNPLTVHFIDYGNSENIETDDFREINKFKNVPRFSAKIRLSEKANKKYKDLKSEDTILVKMVSVDSNNVINVEVQDENYLPIPRVVQTTNTSVPAIPKNLKVDETLVSGNILSPSSNLKNAVNIMSTGEVGILEIHAKLNNNKYAVTLVSNNAISDFHKLLTEVPLTCKQKAENSSHRPQIGELICGQRLDGEWLRGYILSFESPLKMAIIDEARMMTICKTVSCPENFSKICAFGAICEVINAKYKFNASEHCDFKVVKCKSENEIEIEILKDQDKLKAIVKSWRPMPEQKGLQYAELKSGSEVCLTAYRNHVLLFVRSLLTAEVEHYNYIMQNVAKCAQTAPLLDELPVIGQMVIAHYVDNNYYRAIVTAMTDNEVTISYIDFGNIEVTSMKKLRILTDDLKQLRSSTSKIILKDVPQDTPMTKEVSDYLNHLVGAEVPLICTFDGIPFKDGVYLKSHSGENINKTICELLVPTWNKTDVEDTICYMENDITVINLGKIGETTQVIVLHPIVKGYEYAMCSSDYDLLIHIYNIMPKSIAKYCNESKYYIPRNKELCLALFENGWYRAVCICRSETQSTSTVFFIDYGNIESINHKDIRFMPKDFINPSACANICKIVNLAPVDSNGQYSPKIEKTISELVVPESFIEIKIVAYDEHSGVYSVELPLIRKKLIEDGLLS